MGRSRYTEELTWGDWDIAGLPTYCRTLFVFVVTELGGSRNCSPLNEFFPTEQGGPLRQRNKAGESTLLSYLVPLYSFIKSPYIYRPLREPPIVNFLNSRHA